MESRLNATALGGANSSLNNLGPVNDYTSNSPFFQKGVNTLQLNNLSASGLSIVADKFDDYPSQ